jgi:hypothetical protein
MANEQQPALEIILWKAGGPAYLTRSGQRAVVLESNIILATGLHIWQGRVEAEWAEWDQAGKHLGGDSSLDLVEAIHPVGST